MLTIIFHCLYLSFVSLLTLLVVNFSFFHVFHYYPRSLVSSISFSSYLGLLIGLVPSECLRTWASESRYFPFLDTLLKYMDLIFILWDQSYKSFLFLSKLSKCPLLFYSSEKTILYIMFFVKWCGNVQFIHYKFFLVYLSSLWGIIFLIYNFLNYDS